MSRNRGKQERLQSHRTGTYTLGTTDTRLYGSALGFLVVHDQDTGTAFSGRNIGIDQCLTHHRPTADNLACIFGQTTASVDQLLHRRTDTCQEVGRFRQRFTCYRDDTFEQRFVLLHSFIHSEGCTYVLHYGTRRNRQCTGSHLTLNNGIDQLLFTALRIFHFQGNYLDTGIRRSDLRHQLNSVGLVVFDTNECLVHLDSFHQDRHTYHDFFGMFQHQLVVGRQVRLTFHSINDDTFGLECRRRAKLHLRGEAGTTHTNNTGIGYLLDNFFGSQVAFLHQRIGAVNAFFPFVAFHVDEDGRFSVTAGIDNRINLGNFTADRRMNSC